MPALDDRVRAANPVHADDFAGLADFDSLRLAPRRRRPRRALLALPAAAALAAVAALTLLPPSAPQAREIARRASSAFAGGDVYFAQTTASATLTDGSVEDYGMRRIWVRQAPGDAQPTMRWQDKYGDDASEPGDAVQLVPGEIFRAADRLHGDGVDVSEATLNGTPVYVLRWKDRSGPPHWPTIELSLWVDRETYAPLQYRSHDTGLDASGKPLDQTFTETVQTFQRLPATAANLRLLEPTGQSAAPDSASK